MSFLSEIWSYMKVRKKFWLAPLVLIMVIFLTGRGSGRSPEVCPVGQAAHGSGDANGLVKTPLKPR